MLREVAHTVSPSGLLPQKLGLGLLYDGLVLCRLGLSRGFASNLKPRNE